MDITTVKSKKQAPKTKSSKVTENKSPCREMDDADRCFAELESKHPEIKKDWDDSIEERRLGDALIKARTDADISQRELSRKTGIAQCAISNIEWGYANPSLKTLKRLAAGLGLKVKITFENDI